ncbi:hypothetical protein GCM10022240_25040 [Microbacterium kribbense]|uniref:Preprotein translocase subunit YajC n=1 Tax=Microbacterium kribbense TaxID=433645 RepID=A0ABP7GNR0_9MICO
MDLGTFFSNYGLIILLVLLLGFMFWSSRRRMAKQKAEHEAKARETVPGAEVLLQGGLYGTVVSYDADNLDQPAIIEIAPGVDIKVHSQSILRVVSPTTESGDDTEYDAEYDDSEYDDAADAADQAAPHIESSAETAERLRSDQTKKDSPEA